VFSKGGRLGRFSRAVKVGTGDKEWHLGYMCLRVCKVVAMCVMGIRNRSDRVAF